MDTQAPIARRMLLAVDANDREFVLTLGIGQPYEILPDEWACPVSLDGLHGSLVDQHGLDSWQSMQLAYQLVAQLLSYFVQDGGKLFWPDSREPVVLTELIPHLDK